MDNLLQDLLHEYKRHKDLADRALAQIDDDEYFRRPAMHVNPIALIVKHLAGNLVSRWTDFLNSDGEKPGRNRDSEFLLAEGDTRSNLAAAWERGWGALFGTLEQLDHSDLQKLVTIRGESHTICQALLRGMSHVAYHTGQILYLVRWMRPDSTWLTIEPGQSREHRAAYRTSPNQFPGLGSSSRTSSTT